MKNGRMTNYVHAKIIGHWCLVIGHSWVLVLAGCGAKTGGPTLVPAEGLVTLDGKPLSNAQVMLSPQGETRGQAVFGKTDAAGKFVAGSPDGKHKGAAVGSYKVVVSKLVKPDGSDFIPDRNSGPDDTGGYRQLLAEPYSNEAKAILTAEVPDGGTKNLEFKLSSKQK